MQLTLRERINWKRVWLAVLIGYVILVIGVTLAFSYVAQSRPSLINWQANPNIQAITNGK
jgi:hypothetical protein